jgi:hypothetical protein
VGVGERKITHPEGAELQRDTATADWIADRLLLWGADVGTRVCALVPTGYEAYVRVFHHAEERVGSESTRRRWSELAQRSGRQMHPGVQFARFAWPDPPQVGSLDRQEATALVALLCADRVAPGEYFLYRGPIEVVTRFEHLPGHLQTPNMWWPEDRAWFVATEIDFDSTLVACTRACGGVLLGSDLEVLEVSAETRLDLEGDTVNVN